MRGILILAVVVQVAAQTFGGIWGAVVGGVIIGLAAGITGDRGGFRAGFLGAAVAALLLLTVAGIRGANLLPFAGHLGANFGLPAWGVLLASILLPALQSGGVAGGVARLLRLRTRETRTARA